MGDLGSMRRSVAVALLALVSSSSCYDDSIYEDLLALQDALSTSSSTSGADETGLTTSSSASTSSSSSSDGTSSSSSENGGEAEGQIEPLVYLEVTPHVLDVAGPVTFAVEHSSDVERLALFEGDDEEPSLEWLASEPPPQLLITGGDFGSIRTFRVRGYDGEERYGTSDPAFVELQMPPPGTILWEQTFDVGPDGAGRAVSTGPFLGANKIILGFTGIQGALIGRYSMLGDPQLVTSPSEVATSTTRGVALDGDHVLVTGYDTVADKTYPWVAQVDPNTAAVDYLFKGKAGGIATSIAVDPERERIYVSGATPDPKKGIADARVWAFSGSGVMVWTKTWERPVNDPNRVGEPVDVATAVAVLANGDVAIVGETEFEVKPDEDPEVWAFVHRFDPDGVLKPKKSWTSLGSRDTAGARGVSSDRDNGLLVAGWSSVAQDAPRQATIFGFGALLEEAELYTAEVVGRQTAQRVARLPSGELVLAMDVDDKDNAAYYAEVRGLDGQFGPPAWNQVFQGEVVGRVGDLTVTPNGHILVVGTRVALGGNQMYLAALHP